MPPLPLPARCSLARIEQRLQQLVVDSEPSSWSEAGEEAHPIAGADAGGAAAAQASAPAVTDAPACRPPPPSSAPGQPGGFSYAEQLELARLRRERDEAVKEQQAAMRRERDAAASEAAQLRNQLRELQQAHAALERQHAEQARQAEQAAAAAAAGRAAQAAALERLQAAHAASTADAQRKSLRIEALETQQAVLLESYRALEAERRGAAAPLPPVPLLCSPGRQAQRAHGTHAQLATAARDPPCSTDLVPLGRVGWDTSLAEGEAGGDAVERLALSHSHLALAVRCAELQFALGQAERRAQAAQAAAAEAEEQAAGLRLLLAKASSGGAAAMQQRLDAACRQLEEAQALGAQLRRQLAQARRVD